jgi:hypothetical protein
VVEGLFRVVAVDCYGLQPDDRHFCKEYSRSRLLKIACFDIALAAFEVETMDIDAVNWLLGYLVFEERSDFCSEH